MQTEGGGSEALIPENIKTAQTLDSLGKRYKTDKSSLEHDYLNLYEKFIPFSRVDVFTMLEIGVFRGSSVRMWAEWFPNAQIVGVDVKPPKLKSMASNLTLVRGDATQISTFNRLRRNFDAPGIILDDGSHHWEQQRQSLRLLWPWLRSGGVYIVEDLHSSSEAGFTSDEVIPFVDVLLRVASFLQLRNPGRENVLDLAPSWFSQMLREVSSITFINSSALISKK